MSIVNGKKRRKMAREFRRAKDPATKKPRPDQEFRCEWCKRTVVCYHPRWLKPSWFEGAVEGRRAFWCSRKCGQDMGILP